MPNVNENWYRLCDQHHKLGASMAREDVLFWQADGVPVQEYQRKKMADDIAGMDANRLLNANVDDLVAYFVEGYTIEVPVLDEAGATADQHEAKRDVTGDPRRAAYYLNRNEPVYAPGTEVIIEVPFSGDGGLFRVRPSTYNHNPPRGEVRGNNLVFRYWDDNPKTEKVRTEFDHWLADVKQWLQWQRETFKSFNDNIQATARTAISQRRDKLLANQNMVAGLGIALKRRPDAPNTYSAPEVKRKIAPKMPPSTSGTYKPEPLLEEAEYQHILDVIEGMVHVMERSPKAFHDIEEESLRTHFLVQLNGHYEGQASGETFNYQGKTDILIRSGDRNIFIAECKFWSGPAKLTETINQLLGYLSWRDSKAAILLFNRNKDFSKVLDAVPPVVKAHPNFQKDEGKRGETGFRFAFRHKDDSAKVLHLTIMAFDIPQPA